MWRRHRQRRVPDPIVQAEGVAQRIHVLRGERVMLDEDLAQLYGVTTSALNQAVERNTGRFPDDFAFRISASEQAGMRSRSVISIRGRGGRRRQRLRQVNEDRAVGAQPAAPRDLMSDGSRPAGNGSP